MLYTLKVASGKPLKTDTRECWNWQTGMTKDHVHSFACGFKSHLPHRKSFRFSEAFFISFISPITSPFNYDVGDFFCVSPVFLHIMDGLNSYDPDSFHTARR